MGYMGPYYRIPKAIFYLLKGDCIQNRGPTIQIHSRKLTWKSRKGYLGPYEDYSPLQGDPISFHVSLGE